VTSLGNQRKKRQTHRKFAGRDGLVGTATCHGLDCPGMESRWGFKTSRPAWKVLKTQIGAWGVYSPQIAVGLRASVVFACVYILPHRGSANLCLKTGVILDHLKEVLKSRIILFVRKHNSYVSVCLQGTRNSRYYLTLFPAIFFHSFSPVFFTFVLGAFTKLWKATISFVMSSSRVFTLVYWTVRSSQNVGKELPPYDA